MNPGVGREGGTLAVLGPMRKYCTQKRREGERRKGDGQTVETA